MSFLCRNCNSYLGTKLEASVAALVGLVRQEASGRQVATVRFGPPDGPRPLYRATFEDKSESEHSVSLKELGKVSEYVRSRLRDERGALLLEFRGQSDELAKLAFASWAYLALFARFGYSYALSYAAETVRGDLADGYAQRMGPFFFISDGDITGPLESAEVALISVAPLDLNPQFRLIALGARIGAAMVCLPLASDEKAERLYSLLPFVQPDGSVAATMVDFPFEDLYTETRGRSLLAASCQFLYTEGNRTIAVVQADRAAAVRLLGSSAALSVRSTPRPVTQASDTDWSLRLPRLPAVIEPADWSSTVASDAAARMEQLGASPDTATLIRTMGRSMSPNEFVIAVGKVLRPHLLMHVQEEYRVFILGEQPRRRLGDDIRQTGERARLVVRLHGRGRRASIGVDVHAVEPGSRVAFCAMRVAIGDQQLVIGPFYSLAVVRGALDELLPPWLGSLP